MLRVWYGDEPYLIAAKKEKEKALIENPSINVIDNGDELNEESFELCYAAPFFGDKRYMVFTAADLKNPYIPKLIADEPENEIRIIVSKFEANLKVAKSLKKEQVQEFKRMTGKDIPGFVKYFLSKWPTKIREADFNYLVSRIDYPERTGCDLYSVRNWLQALFCLDEVTKTDIDSVIPVNEKSNAFALFKLLTEKKAEKYFLLSERLLLSEDAIGLISLLLSNFRIAYKASLVKSPESEIGVPKFRIASVPGQTCQKCMTILQDGVNSVKSGENGRDVFMRTSAELMTFL